MRAIPGGERRMAMLAARLEDGAGEMAAVAAMAGEAAVVVEAMEVPRQFLDEESA
jgi:hypothetical protein